MKIITISLILIFLFGGLFVYNSSDTFSLGGFGTSRSTAPSSVCRIATSTRALIGPGNSRELAATSTDRAWITIMSTTTPVYLGLDGRKAVVGKGLLLQADSSGSATSSLTLSINAPLFTDGAIAGRIRGASTSVMVTECKN